MMTAMRDAPVGEGERLQRAHSRRHVTVKGSLFAIGLGTGAYLGRRGSQLTTDTIVRNNTASGNGRPHFSKN